MTARLIAAALCAALSLGIVAAISGCNSRGPVGTASESTTIPVSPGTPFFSRGMDWTKSVPSVSLGEALAQVGAPVSLPDESLVGTATKIALDPTGAWPDGGSPGLLFVYVSGVQLAIDHHLHDMKRIPASTVATFTDGRTSLVVPADVDGTAVLVGEAGIQKTSHGDNPVPAQLIWNAGGLGYRLVAASENASTGVLITVMRSMRPVR